MSRKPAKLRGMLLYDANSTSGESLDLAPTLAALLKAAGDELRLQILHVLSRDSFGVQELCAVFNIKQSALSHHLKVLSNAGLVTTRREGNSIFYRRAHTIDPQDLLALQQSILHSSDLIQLDHNTLQGIADVQQERSENSRQFFNDNAEKFAAQQDLIASIEQYGPSVAELIQSLDSRELAIEIGPGAGDFLTSLSPLFKQVIAIDNSPEMLSQSQQRVRTEQLNNVSLQLGDTRAAVEIYSKQADCVIANMVLHHTPNPAEICHELSQCLKAGGSLIICDLLSHDQSWARENCGDVWLGFDENELKSWASLAGLNSGQETFLTLRNGFRIQVQQFLKN